jgi:hypothetical protein
VLDALVDRQQHQRPASGTELEKQPAQAGALARRQGRKQ